MRWYFCKLSVTLTRIGTYVPSADRQTGMSICRRFRRYVSKFVLLLQSCNVRCRLVARQCLPTRRSPPVIKKNTCSDRHAQVSLTILFALLFNGAMGRGFARDTLIEKPGPSKAHRSSVRPRECDPSRPIKTSKH